MKGLSTWIKRQRYAFLSGYHVYRVTLSALKGGFDPRPRLIDALEAAIYDDVGERRVIAALHTALTKGGETG